MSPLDLADQRARDRRADRDHALLEVGLVVADDLVGDLGAAVLVLEVDGRAEDDAAVGVERRRVDDLRRGELALDLEDAALDEALLLLGRLVLGVLRQVAVRARLGDRLDDGVALDGLQPAAARPCSFSAPRRVSGIVVMVWNLGDKNKAAAGASGGGAGVAVSLVQFGVQFLQRHTAEVVAVLHAFDRRLAAGHAGVVGDAVGQRGAGGCGASRRSPCASPRRC